MSIYRKNLYLVIPSSLIVLLVILSLISCSGAGMLGRLGNNEQDQADDSIEIFELEKGDIIQLVAVTGFIDSFTQNYFSMPVSGEILYSVKKGEAFELGDLLVEIDNAEALDQIEQIKKDIADAESSLKIAHINYQSALDANHIAVQLAKINAEGADRERQNALTSLESANRAAQLSLESVQLALDNAKTEQEQQVAEIQLEEAKNSGKSTQSQAESSYGQAIDSQSVTYWNNLSSTQSAEMQIELMAENLVQTETALEEAKEALEESQETLLDYKLNASYDGVVFSSDFRIGEQANGSSQIILISDDFIVRVMVSENDIFKISEGIEALITLDAYTGIELPGKVEEIIPISVNDGGVTSYEVLIGFEYSQDIDIYHGLSANASIITRKAEDVLYVPIQAVYKESGRSFVDLLTTFEVEPENILEAVEQKEITTGINDYQFIEVTSGLKEGDIIVTSRIR